MSFFARFISSSEEGAQAADEPKHYLLPDGRTVYVSRERERVLMFASLEDIYGGRKQHGNYPVEPVWLINLAKQRGDVVDCCLIIPVTSINEQTCTAWAGFRMIPKLPNTIAVTANVTLVNSPTFILPIHAIIVKTVEQLNPSVVMLVTTNEIPPSVFAYLRDRSVRIEVLNPKRNGGQSSRHADKVEFLGTALNRYLAHQKKEEEPRQESVRVVYVTVPPKTERAVERLARQDPETLEEIGRVVSVTDEEVQKELRRLCRQFKNDAMSKTVLAVLLALATIPEGDDKQLDYNDLLLRFILNGVDCREVGQMVLSILVEEGTLAAVPRGTGRDYLFTGDPDDPPHRLARRFYGEILRSRNVVHRRSEQPFATRVIQAAEINKVSSAHMTPEAQADLNRWFALNASTVSPTDRATAFAALGMSYKEGVALNEAVLNIMHVPYDGIDQEDQEAEEPPTSRTTQRVG
jgi:hypothetical protein